MINRTILQVLKCQSLQFLEELQKAEPNKRIYLNLFDTGIVIDSLDVRNSIIEYLIKQIRYKRVYRKRKR